MEFSIGNKQVGINQPVFIIAEMSANHGGSLDRALEIIRAAKRAGADAIKLQTYRADTITLECNKPDFIIPDDSPWADSTTLYELYQKAQTPWQWHQALFDEAKNLNLEIFSSPFDSTAVELLESLDVVAYKIASPEINDLALLKCVAKTGKPIILSTGLAEKSDIDKAVKVLKDEGCAHYGILKCTTAYPAPIEEANLRLITKIKDDYKCLSGLSDHTQGQESVIAAVALGANIIEKHFMLDDAEETADSFFSLTETEFKAMVNSVRKTSLALGNGRYQLSTSAQNNRSGRRSLYIAKDIQKGEILESCHVKSVRPAYGLAPEFYEQILGKRVTQDLQLGDRLSWDVIEQ